MNNRSISHWGIGSLNPPVGGEGVSLLLVGEGVRG